MARRSKGRTAAVTEERGPLTRRQQRKESVMKYQCLLCSYVYDPAVGDPENGVEAGTEFADLPDDWVCPDCGADKDQFEPLED